VGLGFEIYSGDSYFRVKSTITKVINGVEETKSKYAEVYVLDFVVESMSLSEDESLNTLTIFVGTGTKLDIYYVIQTPNTISFDSAEQNLYSNIINKINSFKNTSFVADKKDGYTKRIQYVTGSTYTLAGNNGIYYENSNVTISDVYSGVEYQYTS
jgi:hypothetical protein